MYVIGSRQHGHRLVAAVAIVVSAAMPLATRPAQAQDVVVVEVDVKEVAEGFRASQLTGMDVANEAGETIGDIDDLIVSKDKVTYAIIEVGGFLGIGGHLIAVPFNTLAISDDGEKTVLANASKEEVEAMPEFNCER
jgi:sporulation protein YlmC with PRC-barrel domain